MAALTNYTDKELFLLISEGDETAFGILFNRYIEQLHPFAFSITKSAAAAEEMIQETFIRIWLNRDKLPDIDNPHSWIFTIAARESIGYLRKRVADERHHKMAANIQPDNDDVITAQIGLKELKALVHEAVEQLSPQRKRVFKMSREEGMKINEIAEALDIAPNTVKNMLVTSVKQVREYLNSKGHMLGALLILFLRDR